MYYDMSIIRRIENTASQLYKDRHVRGFLHLYVAQEACCVGIKSVMNPGDCVTTAYRCHGWAYMCGIAARAILAELMGKVTGCSRGKGGSMHLYSPLFLGGNGIVGAHVPVGTGMAFAYKYLNKDNVSVVLYGDGAANQGQVFESYNLAKLHSLPVVYICENNKFGMGTKAEGSSANTKYYTRCEYIPGLWVDGMNVLSMREGMKFALDYCRKGNGPFLMEADTYRYLGHSMSDPGTSYRTREEVKAIRETRDAIMSLKEKLIAGKLATEEECKAIEKKVKEEVEEAAKQALDDKFSPTEELVADVYSNPIRNITRGVAPWDMHPVKNVGKPINTT
ncbi:probable pyruvate dehydrogenase E1 component subunit alpha, mitochondrial [Periplaneta americana]|uniref:probable pyruvate dehydrogenase E1 component subunit alpha, mitochondrial n=1 Tax=Periplaneta americana TaxID=6978 RepID=UPI0037E863BD